MGPIRIRLQQSVLDNQVAPFPSLVPLYDYKWYKVEYCHDGSAYFKNNSGNMDAVRLGSNKIDFEFEHDDVDKILEKYTK